MGLGLGEERPARQDMAAREEDIVGGIVGAVIEGNDRASSSKVVIQSQESEVLFTRINGSESGELPAQHTHSYELTTSGESQRSPLMNHKIPKIRSFLTANLKISGRSISTFKRV